MDSGKGKAIIFNEKNKCLKLQVPANKENIGFKMYIHVQQVKIGCQV